MRTILRAGGIVGGVFCVALAALQLVVAQMVIIGVALAGLIAGLCVAKWLERWWYGRQLEAGARGGLYACALAGSGALASLLLRGPHDLDTLAQRSHLGQLDLAPVVRALAFFDWIGADILLVAVAAVAGVLLAALAAQITGWSKSGHALRVVEQARLTAEALARDEAPTPASGSNPLQGIPAATLLNPLPGAAFTGAPTPLAGAPSALGLAAPGLAAPGLMPNAVSSPGFTRMTQAPAPLPLGTAGPAPMAPTASRREQAAPAAPAAAEATQATLPAASAQRVRKSSSARPAGKQLTQAMRDALAAWAEDNVEAEAAGKARAPQPSTYLNSAPPVVKRNRKKNATRDWIC
jgi:hypothetical protein